MRRYKRRFSFCGARPESFARRLEDRRMTATLIIGALAAAMAQQQTDTTFTIRAGAHVEVEAFGGSINVKTWDRNAIRVQAVHGRRDVVSVDGRGSSIRIEAEGR